MDNLKKEDFLRNLLIIFRETFEGSPEGQGSAYLDRGVGIFNSLDAVSAEAASQTLGGATIAAHTEHAKFYLDRLCEFINGRTEPVNWEQSWLIETVNDAEWAALRDSVRRTYESTLRCFASVEEWHDDATGNAIAMIAHTAYHLGSIRQIAKAV